MQVFVPSNEQVTCTTEKLDLEIENLHKNQTKKKPKQDIYVRETFFKAQRKRGKD